MTSIMVIFLIDPLGKTVLGLGLGVEKLGFVAHGETIRARLRTGGSF